MEERCMSRYSRLGQGCRGAGLLCAETLERAE